MLVKEYLSKFDEYTDVTFIKARVRKDAGSPGYHAEYQTTPISHIYELRKSKIMDYYVLNNKQTPIDWLSGAPWKVAFDNGRLLSLLVISKEDIETLYSPEQAMQMIEFIDGKLQ